MMMTKKKFLVLNYLNVKLTTIEFLIVKNKKTYKSSFMLLKDLVDSINTSMLMVQYRMHPSIAMWPSWRFYDDKLINGIGRDQRRPPRGIQWPAEVSSATPSNPDISHDGKRLQPILFIDCSMGIEETDTSMSKKNLVEVEVI